MINILPYLEGNWTKVEAARNCVDRSLSILELSTKRFQTQQEVEAYIKDNPHQYIDSCHIINDYIELKSATGKDTGAKLIIADWLETDSVPTETLTVQFKKHNITNLLEIWGEKEVVKQLGEKLYHILTTTLPS